MRDNLQNLKSRKFWTLIGLFIASFLLAIINPSLIGSAIILFNFWTGLSAVFFGADTYGKYTTAKSNGGEMPDHKWMSKKFIALIGLLAAGFALAVAYPLFVGTGTVLFTYWISIITLYFGANVLEKKLTGYVMKLKGVAEDMLKNKQDNNPPPKEQHIKK